MRRSLSTASALAALALLATVPSSEAGTTTVRFKPVRAGRHVLVYRPYGMRPASIRQAHVRLRAHRRRVAVRKVRRAVRGHSRMRVSHTHGATSGVLLLSKRRHPDRRHPDTTPPDTTITGGPSGTTADSTPTYALSSSESSSTFQCRYDSASFARCSGPGGSDTPATALADGSHTFAARAIDAAGNVDPTPATHGVTVSPDTTPPDTTITGGPSGTTADSTPTYALSSSESSSTFQCRYDSASFARCSGPGGSDTPATALADGSHTFAARAIDAAGNVDPTPATHGVTVDTTTAPPPAGGGCTSAAFSSSNEPGSCWVPYSPSSPFNTTVSASPTIDPNSSAIVSRLLGFGSIAKFAVGTSGTNYDWSHPVYWSQSSDPLYTIKCTGAAYGACSQVNGMQLQIPPQAKPAGNGAVGSNHIPTYSDAHMTVIDQSTGWEWDFWHASMDNTTHTIYAEGTGRISITGNGLGSGADAGYFGLYAGQIRGEEMQAGQINHALFMTVYCSNDGRVEPAGSSKGRPCSSVGLSNANAPAMGQHFYLAMSDAEIAALPDPAWQKTILRAMAHYGLYVGDTGGSSWAIQPLSGSTYTSFGNTDPWVTFAQQAGVPSSNGIYSFDLSGAVDWASKLKVLTPGS